MATGAATLAGGALALRLGAGLRRVMGFGSGAVIGVALMDLLPEALGLGRGLWRPLSLTALTAAGFMAYVLIDRFADRVGARSRRIAQNLGPASLVFHSLMDGLGIGVAFNVSAAVGAVVAAAVLAHDLMDGANTVTLGVAARLSPARTRRWLIADAAAPLLGLILSRAIDPSPRVVAALLAAFAGMFLYIGAVELLPKSRQADAGLMGALLTALGAAAIFLIVSTHP